MCVSTVYHHIGRESFTEQASFYMMNSLLYSRMESGFPSNDEYYDEDVNIYLANLLSTLIDPACHATFAKYVVPYDIQLFESVNAHQNPRKKYQTYKANADFILISLGLFDNPRWRRPNSVSYLQLPGASFVGRGKTYYRLAQSYAMETFRRTTAVSDVLGKLSSGLEKYMRVLSLMRGEYFNLYRKISDGTVYHLARSATEMEKEGTLNRRYDCFLDAYSNYRRSRSAAAKRELKQAVERVRELNPDFDFSID